MATKTSPGLAQSARWVAARTSVDASAGAGGWRSSAAARSPSLIPPSVGRSRVGARDRPWRRDDGAPHRGTPSSSVRRSARGGELGVGQLRGDVLENGRVDHLGDLLDVLAQDEGQLGDERAGGVPQELHLAEGEALLLVLPGEVTDQARDDLEVAGAQPLGVALDAPGPDLLLLLAGLEQDVEDLPDLVQVDRGADADLFGSLHRDRHLEVVVMDLEPQVLATLTADAAGEGLFHRRGAVVRMNDNLTSREFQSDPFHEKSATLGATANAPSVCLTRPTCVIPPDGPAGLGRGRRHGGIRSHFR